MVLGEADGKGFHVLELAEEQRRRGAIAPTVLTFPSAAYTRALVRSPIRVIRLPTPRILVLLLRGARQIRAAGASVLHAHGYKSLFLIVLLRLTRPKAWRNVPVVFTMHGLPQTTRRRRVINKLQFLCYPLVDVVVACSREQLEMLKRSAPKSTGVYVPNGIRDPGWTRNARRSAGRSTPALVLGVGRLSKEKGFHVFVDACAAVHQVAPDVLFCVAGAGPESARLAARIRELGLDGAVTLAGHVDDLDPLWSRATLLLQTSGTESTPRAVLEAMIRGVPVVATAVGGIPDIVRDSVDGLLVPPADPHAAAYAVLTLLSDRGRGEAMGRQAIKTARGAFSIGTMHDRLSDAYVLAASIARLRAGALRAPAEVGARLARDAFASADVTWRSSPR
ncbi:MAG: glycosyltransferase family 4 protein [Actinomycetota bacterium]|nr:glycosyltransferase family 4 protein [Actinomycetota bacterium]